MSEARLKSKSGSSSVDSRPSANGGRALRYRSLEVHNFRCFQELRVDDFERVNLITGENNVGKTALLEALFLHSGGLNPALILLISGLRGVSSFKVEAGRAVDPPWGSLFNEFDDSRDIRLAAKDLRGLSRTMRIGILRNGRELERISRLMGLASAEAKATAPSSKRLDALQLDYRDGNRQASSFLFAGPGGGFATDPAVPPPPSFPAQFVGARGGADFAQEAELFGQLEVQGKQDVLVRILNLIEPRLKRVAVVLFGGTPMLHADLGLGRLVPLAFVGDGMLRLTRLFLYVIRVSGGAIFVDEIENGFHHSALTRIWRALAESARQFNAQIFATAHSLECVAAAHNAFVESGQYDFHLHRLERMKDGIRAVTYDQEALAGAIQSGFEVR